MGDMHFHQDGRELRQGDLQGAEHREGHRAQMHGVQQEGHRAARDDSMSEVDRLLRQGHLRGGERREDLGWELTPDEMAWLQREGALSGAQRSRGYIDVEEERKFQEVLEGIPRKVWPKVYWGESFVQQYRDMESARLGNKRVGGKAETPKAETPKEAETPFKEAETPFKEAETPKEAETTKAETPEEAVRPPKDCESWSAGSRCGNHQCQ